MPDLGIGEAIATFLAADLAVGAETAATAGPIIAGAGEGAAVGAGLSAATGGDPLKGALAGGVTGGAIPAFGPVLSEATGLGLTASEGLVGAGAGAAGAAITGQDPLFGAVGGGASGLISGALAPSSGAPSATVTPTPATGAAGGTGAASLAPSTITPTGGAPVDLTSGNFATGVPGAGAADTFGITSPGAAFGDWSARPAATVGETGGSVSGIGSKIMGFAEKNPGVLLGGALLGANMLMGDRQLPAEKAIQQAAGEAGSMGRTLGAYQMSGTLPPGLQTLVDQQIEAAKAQLVSQYSDAGLGHSTMLADKLNQLKAQKSAEIAQFADNLAKQGIEYTKLSANEFNTLLNAQVTQESDFAKSLGLFAAGLAGMRPSSSTSA